MAVIRKGGSYYNLNVMAIKQYRYTKLHLAAAFLLAVLGVVLIISAMFIPPMGYGWNGLSQRKSYKHQKRRTMRTITLIIIHCSAVRPNQQSSAKDITLWHKARGWRTIGYHYVVRRDGTIEYGRPIEQVGAHCVNHNRYSVGICYEGGLDTEGKPKDTRTEAQKTAIRQLIQRLKKTYPLAVIVGHRDLNPLKACPCFNAVSEYRDLQP